MPSYKLIYFNLRGRAELARLIFAQAGQQFVDERIEAKDWPEKKKETPFGQLPVLMIDGKPLPQSLVIARYLARIFKLDGDTPLEAAYCDMVVESITEAINKLPFTEKDEKKKEELMKKCYQENIRPVFVKIEKKFSEENKNFLVGKKLTYADLAIMDFLTTFDSQEPGFSDAFPNLKALSERVKQMKNIKEWIAKRPQTNY